MAIQDQTQGGLGIRRLTEEERRARAARLQAQLETPVTGPRNPAPSVPVTGQVQRFTDEELARAAQFQSRLETPVAGPRNPDPAYPARGQVQRGPAALEAAEDQARFAVEQDNRAAMLRDTVQDRTREIIDMEMARGAAFSEDTAMRNAETAAVSSQPAQPFQPSTGLGVRRLTEEERARIAAQQAQYQQQLAARQATEQQNFEQTQAVGLANQAGTPGAPMLPPAVVPPVIQPVDVPATTSVLPPTPAPATASPAFDVAASDQRIRDIAAQGRSELGAQPLNIAGLNAQLADRVRTQQAPASIPGVRGDYNLANTSTVDRAGQITSTLRQPDNIIEGGYGGFGVGGNQGLSAREFLTRAEAQDAATRARVGERRREIAADVERIGLRNATTRGSATERRAARQALATFEEQQRTQSTTRLQEAGATERAQLQAQAEQARAGIAGAAGVQAALARAAGAQQAAQISAGATTEAARLRAAGLQGAAQTTATSPQAQLAAARAQLIQEQLTLAQQAQQAGDVAGTQAALGVRQSQPQLIRDNINGLVIGYVDAQGQPVLYTPEQLAQQRAALQPTQE